MKKIFTNIIKYPLTMFFTVFILCFFLGYLFVPQKEKSEMENRFLSVRPDVTFSTLLDGSFMKSFEEYTNDQIVFREKLIKTKAVTEMALLKNVNNGIVRGKNGYLFSEDISDGSTFKKNKVAIKKALADTIINGKRNVSIAIAPNAVEILKDYVPTGMPHLNQGEKLAEFNSEISLLDGLTVIDLVQALNSRGEEYLYYRTDHHWTTLGAYLAYEAISNNPVSIDTLDYNEINDFYGTLYAKYKGAFVNGDIVRYYDIPIESADFGDEVHETLYDLSKADVFDKYGVFLYGNHGISEILCKKNLDTGFISDEGVELKSIGDVYSEDLDKNSEECDANTLIVFKDSYANSVIPFLTMDYDKIILVDLRYYGDSVKKLLNSNEKADVLLLYNFDFLNEDNHFYKLTK